MPVPVPGPTKYIHAPAPCAPPPQYTILNIAGPPAPEKKPCCVEEPCCPQFDRVELSEDEEEPMIPEIRNVGVELSEFELLKNVVFGLRGALAELQDSTETNQEVIAKNMLVLQGNIRLLEEKLMAQNTMVETNTMEIKGLRAEMALMNSEFERMLDEVGRSVA